MTVATWPLDTHNTRACKDRQLINPRDPGQLCGSKSMRHHQRRCALRCCRVVVLRSFFPQDLCYRLSILRILPLVCTVRTQPTFSAWVTRLQWTHRHKGQNVADGLASAGKKRAAGPRATAGAGSGFWTRLFGGTWPVFAQAYTISKSLARLPCEPTTRTNRFITFFMIPPIRHSQICALPALATLDSSITVPQRDAAQRQLHVQPSSHACAEAQRGRRG